eukprot:GILK01001613.1.p1 GENE.GILK01001613.1~~GILK01001613.1.p1  ORF type:complete len:300 (-),score=40.60 GILK01001613.1:193-1053(-)
MSEVFRQSTAVLLDPTFPHDAEGRTMHLAVKTGDVANRVLSVGDPERAARLSKFLTNTKVVSSKRGFVTYTGLFQEVPVTIIATGMGIPMMDFVVREIRSVVEGNMAITRYGTCGCLNPSIVPGSVVVASKGAVSITRNFDAFLTKDGDLPPYTFSQPVLPDKELSALLASSCHEEIGDSHVFEGLNATADSFYSSQGRTGTQFDDRNEDLITLLKERYPEVTTLEMETFQLFHLAHCSKGTVKASAAAITLFNRSTLQVCPEATLHERETQGGNAILRALVKCEL